MFFVCRCECIELLRKLDEANITGKNYRETERDIHVKVKTKSTKLNIKKYQFDY